MITLFSLGLFACGKVGDKVDDLKDAAGEAEESYCGIV